MKRNRINFIYTNSKLWLVNKTISPQSRTGLNVVASLKKHGISILPNYYSKDLINTLCCNIPQLDRFSVSPEGDYSYYLPQASSLKETQFFFNDPLIEEVARGYLGRTAVPLRETIGIKRKRNHVSFETFAHRDSWLPRLKVFLYLNDVRSGNSPFCYLKGTHKFSLESVRSRYLIYRDYLSNDESYAKSADVHYVGCYWPHDINKLNKRGLYKITRAHYDAGTVIFFDARGIHYGEVLKRGVRYILNSYWILDNYHT